jgi:SAM-dependent methyltransferase
VPAAPSDQPVPRGLTDQNPHRHREWAESFGTDPERYHRTRPRYPAAFVRELVDELPGREVLDVGVGTGIVARQLQTAGCRVLGVDVDERMAESARRRGFEVEVAPFETWDPAGRTFDAVVAGQTWHWVDPVAGTTKAVEVLRPGGRLAVFWNAGDPPPELTEAFAAVYRRLLPDLPEPFGVESAVDGYGRFLDTAEDAIRQTTGFGEPEQRRYPWEQTYTRDAWLDQLPTSGFFAQIPPHTARAVVAGIGEAVDAAGGAFTMRYTTVVVAAERVPAP